MKPRTASLGAAVARWAWLMVTFVAITGFLALSIALSFVIQLPLLAYWSWQDWRFHARRYPELKISLLSSVRLQLRIWWHEVMRP